MKTQIENNKLIAEFMGLVIITDNISYFDTDYKPIKKYQSDWNELMAVIEKCLVGEAESPEKLISAIYEGITSINLSASHKAAVEFIKWYNESK